ncbi:transposase%2C IS1167%2C internal deletion [Streptococcus pneumoniae]|uniref:ISL3 family transposase n=1 Tax=Streptococcus pneumoniae TaxID=1313 RepID=UPI0005E76683|nr:ISL3 family transposase [Streptococcus pneumoniae]CJS19834.1 transposase%2C IS1167%2C internal deletion [Streptococcus pneumoniae]
MEQLHFITKLLDIKDTNIQIIDVVNRDSHKEIIAKLDYDAPSCPECGNQLKKYDFQKPSKIPYLETSDKHFYRPTFRMHLTNKEILDKILSYSEDLKHHYQIYQLLLFHFQNKDLEKFFGLIEDNLKQVHPIFQTVFKTFLKNKEKIVNALQLPYSNAKLEATNNLIKLIKRNAFGFRNFENFKKRIFIALNIKKERTNFVLSRA